MKRTKLNGKFWAALIIFSLVGQVAWVVENMYFNVFIYKMFHASPPSSSAPCPTSWASGSSSCAGATSFGAFPSGALR